MIPPAPDAPLKDPLTAVAATEVAPGGRSHAENCKRIRALGFTSSRHIKMYGERLELVSEPFEDGGCTSVLALSGDDPTAHTVRLPVAILLGLSDRFRKK